MEIKRYNIDTGTKELAHIEMVATMIIKLLDGAPVGDLEGGGDSSGHWCYFG